VYAALLCAANQSLEESPVRSDGAPSGCFPAVRNTGEEALLREWVAKFCKARVHLQRPSAAAKGSGIVGWWQHCYALLHLRTVVSNELGCSRPTVPATVKLRAGEALSAQVT